MKFPASLRPWLMVPVAAGAGYFAGSRGAINRSAAQSPASVAAQGSSEQTGRHAGKNPASGWAARLEQASAADLPGIYREIHALKEVDETRWALRLLCARWAELDAPGGVEFLNQTGPEFKDAWSRIWLLTEWALRDPAAAYAAVSRLPGKDAYWEAFSVGSEILRENPARFMDWFRLARAPLPQPGMSGWDEVARLHLTELQAMAGEIAANPPQGGAQAFFEVLAAALARQQPAEAMAWAKNQPPEVRDGALVGVLSAVGGTAPELFLDLLDQARSAGAVDLYLDKAVTKTMQSLIRQDPAKAVTWLNTHFGKLGNHADNAVIELGTEFIDLLKAGTMTPAQAFDAVKNAARDDESIRLNVLRRMWSGLPAGELAQAAQWLKDQPSDSARGFAFGGLMQAWVAVDEAGATAFAGRIGDEGIRQDFHENLLQSKADTAGPEFTALLQRVPGDTRTAWISQLTKTLEYSPVRYSPPDFAGMGASLEGLPVNPDTAKALSGVARIWSLTDPIGALTWAQTQSDPAARETAITAATAAWAQADEWGASQWINQLPSGDTRDLASSQLVKTLSPDEPDSAWVWAGQIQDSARRLEAQATVLNHWGKASPDAALAALEKIDNTLPAEARQRLTEAVSQPPPAK